MQLIAGQKIGNNLWVSVSLASRGKRSKMPGCFAGAQLWGLFSCICAFPGGRTLLSVCSKKENLALKWQLSHYSPRYGLYVFIDVLFTQSSIFGVYFRSKSAWWVIHSVSLYFLHMFLRCREMHCKVYKVGGNNDKNEALHLLMGHTLNLTALLFNQCRVLLYFHCDYPLSAIYSCFIKTVLMLR